MTVTPLKKIDDSHIISKRHFLTNIKLEDKQGSKDSMIDIVSNRMAFKLENRLSEIRQNGTQRYSSSRTIQRALLTPKYHPANTTYHSRNMFCINKIEIQGRTKELQTQISGTAPQQLIVQGKLISLPRRHYYSTILTFFFFFDFSDDDCGTAEVVLLCMPRAWDPWEALPGMFECPRLLSSFLFCLCLGVGSALHWPSERAEPWLLRFFDALVNRDLVFLEEPGKPQENRSSIRCLFLAVIMIEWRTGH